MMPSKPGVLHGETENLIRAFEAAWVRDGDARPADYVPPADSPAYRLVLRELVRVDLEFRWDRGSPLPLTEYQRQFPQLFEDRESVEQIAFEEYRLRVQAGELPSTAEYERLFGIDASSWPDQGNGTALTPAPSCRDLKIEEAALSYQEFRQRHASDDLGALHAWCDSVLGSLDAARVFRGIHYADPAAAQGLASAVTALANLGDDFEGFRLLGELGRGAFARVFLAQQRELSDRPMVLKLSVRRLDEPQLLARLQHTHIVPVYSVHRSGPIQAVCMPFFGATTLADVLHDLRSLKIVPQTGQAVVDSLQSRQRGLGHDCPVNPAPAALEQLPKQSYVRTVLVIATGLVEGLAHAHERGVVHRDLKPANVLLTDEGRPMLLDFNLSEDTKLSRLASAARIGGTLPYMSPEQLSAFRDGAAVDVRSDLYSIGLILYELLTTRPAFAPRSGPADEVLGDLIADRRQPPPPMRVQNRAVTPAVKSIVQRCLEVDPARRYQSASELLTDLQRQLADRPLQFAAEPSMRERLQKWARRHPRLVSGLASSTTVAGLAAIVLAVVLTMLVIGRARLTRLEAREARDQFRDDWRTAQFLLQTRQPDAERLARGTQVCFTALARYHVLDDPSWQSQSGVRALAPQEQAELVHEVGELLWILARATALHASLIADPAGRDAELRRALQFNAEAETCLDPAQPSRAIWLQRAGLLQLLGQEREAADLRARAETAPVATPRDRFLLAVAYRDRGDFGRALDLLQTATRQDPQDVWAWFLLGNCHDELAQDPDALACYTACIALWPRVHQFHFDRGLVHLRQRRFRDALADFDEAIRLEPQEAGAYINRAVARQGLGDHGGAALDLTQALHLGSPATRIYFMRAFAREKAGDTAGARRDREEGLRRTPTDDSSWVARGMARLKADPRGALADFQAAARSNPRSLPALQDQAHVLSEHLGRPQEAIAVLNRVVELYPDFVDARVGRGVLFARLGQRAQAHADAQWTLGRDARPPTLYQAACIYALTSRASPEDAVQVFPLLARALRGGFGIDLLDKDPDLEPVRRRPEFGRLRDAARTIRVAA